MVFSGRLSKISKWLAGRGNVSADTAEYTADDLRIARHNEFCTAIPFPSLSWNKDENPETNLEELHDYAAQLANSALDWYLEKKSEKKKYAQRLHFLMYAIGVFAVLGPLFLLVVNPDFEILGVRYPNSRAFAAELALALIGIIGGITFVDRSGGYTADWMRYITAAARLNRALIEFEFDWSLLSRAALIAPTTRTASNVTQENNLATRRRGNNKVDSVTQRIMRLKGFCLAILDIMGAETEVWANELKERVAQISRNLPQPGRP